VEKRKLGDKNISLLGFGLMRLPRIQGTFETDYESAEKLIDHAMASGVNYYDMAYTYSGSEKFAGHALSKYPRDSYYIATKCPPWKLTTKDDFEPIFEGQLKDLRTDYIDFYLVHNFAQEAKRADGNEEFFKHFEKIGMYDMLQKKKAEGKVKHIGFSFHGTPALLEEIVDKYEWDFAQIQLNYIDWTATDAKRQYEILTDHNIPVVIMEPLRGGVLATLNEEAAQMLQSVSPKSSLASWGIRYAASFPNVLSVLSGMNALPQLEDNLETVRHFEPLTESETKLLYEVAGIYNRSGAISCTGCRYCMPCPAGVDIPRIFSIYNHYRLVKFRIPFDNGYSTLTKKEKASACVECGLCVQKCPQHLSIPEHMKEINTFAHAKE